MRLKTLEMQRFGKFRGEKRDLAAGLELIRGANESGKTTTADFIRFMFFGFEKSRARRTLLENPLEKYQPWDCAEGMAGAMELYDEAGRLYRIERTMDAKGKGEVRVLDAEGTQLPVSQPGEYFLGVDGETFSNIFYICQGVNTPRRTAGMDVAMKNLMTTGSEEISIDRVMKFLQNEKAKYSSPKRGMGKLKNLQDEIGEWERSEAYQRALIEQKRAALPDTAETEKEIRDADERLAFLQKEQRRLAAHRAYLRQQKRAQLYARMDELRQSAQAALPSLEETGLLQDIFRHLERAAVVREQAQAKLAELQEQHPALTELQQAVLAYEAAPRGRGNVAAAVLGAVLMGASLALSAWSLWSLLALPVGAILTVVAVIRMGVPASLKKRGIRHKTALREAIQQATEAQTRIDLHRSLLQEAQAQFRQVQEEEQSLQKQYAPMLERCGVQDRAALEALRERQTAAHLQQQRIAELKDRIAELADTEEEDRRIAEAQEHLPDPAALERETARIATEKEQALRLLAQSAAGAAALKEMENELTALQEKLQAGREEYACCTYLNDVAVLAIEAMENAQSALRDNYAPALREKVEQTLSFLTDGKYRTITLDAEFSMRILADGGLRALDYFSEGTRDAAYLALRLSLAQIVEGERRLPLIFDDPFLNLDETRRARLEEYLTKAAKERQILFFSCRE